jgi:hypothetical protein
MSIIDTSGGGIASIGLAFAAKLLGASPSFRKIGPITAPCTISEHHDDDLEVSDHPVELGAEVSDHAFKRPVRVGVVIGWGAGLLLPLSLIYQQLLDLQASAKPFDIVTGKRSYKNMVIASIAVTTDVDSENILLIRLSCREVIIVQTQVTTMPPAANQASPQSTAAPQNSGTVQTAPAATVPSGGALAIGG